MGKKSIAGAWLLLVSCSLGLAIGCASAPKNDPLLTAERLIDTFYSWDAERLSTLVKPGADADNLLYYQAWAEAAHYQVSQRRPCSEESPGNIVCAITVTDDFGEALGYRATDRFTMRITGTTITSITFVGDDPPVFQQLFAWLTATRPEVFSGPCKDLFAGGTTPAACARAVAQGARDFAAQTASAP